MPGDKRAAAAFASAGKGTGKRLPALRAAEVGGRVVALLCADLHLSHRPPIARSAEPDWYNTQSGYLLELGKLSLQYDSAPILVAGDLFDRWNSPAELINFALRYLPHCYAVPGQHDLAHHSYKDKHKTAYSVLVEANRIVDLPPSGSVEVPGAVPLRLHGFPWGFAPRPCPKSNGLCLEIAVVHQYVWTKSTGYPGAPTASWAGKLVRQYKDFDLVVTGDNHVPFAYKNVYNCGAFQRRKRDEKIYTPSVGLLHGDGTVKRHCLDCSQDKWLDVEELAGSLGDVGLQTFLEELTTLGDSALNFAGTVRALLERKKVPKRVKRLVLRFLEV